MLRELAVSVTLGSASLVEGTDFTVSYESSVNVGMATVTVTGHGPLRRYRNLFLPGGA